MSDSWTNVVNNGSFTDYSGYTGSYWGNWDSVEYVLYKSSESLTLEPLSHEYIDYKDDEGNSFSDHSAAAVEFEYTSNGKTADYELKAARRTFPDIFNAIKVVFADLKYAFSHFEDVIIMIKYANDEQYLYENYLV